MLFFFIIEKLVVRDIQTCDRKFILVNIYILDFKAALPEYLKRLKKAMKYSITDIFFKAKLFICTAKFLYFVTFDLNQNNVKYVYRQMMIYLLWLKNK